MFIFGYNNFSEIKYALMKQIISILSSFRLELNFVHICPADENARSDSTLVGRQVIRC